VTAQTTPERAPIVTAHQLKKHFHVRRGFFRRLTLHAVDGVSFAVAPGEVLGIVGESGCGKSTIARMLVGLMEPDDGSMRLGNVDISAGNRRGVDEARKLIQMVFQDSFASLNPRLALRETIAFTAIARGMPRHGAAEKGNRLLAAVGLDPLTFGHRYPHEVSGGQRQRVNIARALAGDPRILVLDEAVSALDKSIEAQVLNLLQDLKEEMDLTYIFISHDLHVVRYMSDRVAVMYLGKIVEYGMAADIMSAPLHPYTQALVRATPTGDPARRVLKPPLEGDPPSAVGLPSGCRFRSRCPRAESICAEAEPELRSDGSRQVACHFAF
jgi:peptide/nickel transport system ATP-binding protein